MAKRKIKKLNRKKLSMLSIFLSRRRVYNDNYIVMGHIDRVFNDGGRGYDTNVLIEFVNGLIEDGEC